MKKKEMLKEVISDTDFKKSHETNYWVHHLILKNKGNN